MAGVAGVIGFVGSVLGIVGFSQDNWPDKVPDEGAKIGVKVGSYDYQVNATAGLEGEVARLWAWNTHNTYLGGSDGKDLEKGGYYEFTIASSDEIEDVTAQYVGLAGGHDAICVSWVTVSQNAKGGIEGAWMGDIGWQCGQSWYHQSEYAGTMKEKGKEKPYVPKCTWFDSDHNRVENKEVKHDPASSMKFDILGYGKDLDDTAQNRKNAKEACKWTAFSELVQPINDAPGNRKAAGSEKRAPHKKRSDAMKGKLVVSNLPAHEAAELCKSDTSHGPDFVDTHGMYCDMETHTLYPLCSKHNVNGCVDIDQGKKAVTKRSFVAKRQVDSTHRSYENVETWEQPAQ